MNGPTWNAATYTPSKLFDGWCFHIPDYQRGYAWEKDQLEDFLEDLELLSRGNAHYTGNMVLQHVDGPEVKDKFGKSYSVYDVVDGQQRLTTIVLLLAAIRRELVQLDECCLAEGIYNTYMAAADRNGQPLPKLTLNSDCHEFFFANVLQDRPQLDGPRIRSHRNLKFAMEHFSDYLSKKKDAPGDRYSKWLEELKDKVCEQLVLTVYPVQRDADAGVIFEVMNNRGKPITEVEKTKNYLLYLASKLDLPDPHDLCKQVNNAWTRIFTSLMASGCATKDDDLLRAHWLMAYDPEEKHWDGCKSIKNRFHLKNYIGRHRILLDDLVAYITTLVDAALAYCDVLKPGNSNAFDGIPVDGTLRKDVVEAAEKLPRLGVFAPFLPLLVAIRMKHPGNWRLYHDALRYCEMYAFRVYRLLLRRSSAGRRDLIRLAHSLYAGRQTPDDVLMAMRGLIARFSRETEVEEAFARDPEDNWYDWTGIKYFLYEYESQLVTEQNKDNPKISWKDLEKLKHSIEHILPQTPTCDYWRSRWNESALATFTNDLGNLCLTRDNSSYGNKPFPEKVGKVGSGQAGYANGNFVMERNLAAYQDWTEETLLERRKEITDWAMKRWGLPTSGTSRQWHFQVPPIMCSWEFRQSVPTLRFTAPLITSNWRFIP